MADVTQDQEAREEAPTEHGCSSAFGAGIAPGTPTVMCECGREFRGETWERAIDAYTLHVVEFIRRPAPSRPEDRGARLERIEDRYGLLAHKTVQPPPRGEGLVHGLNVTKDGASRDPAGEGEEGDIVADGEERWATARRIASDDHPTDCACVRDHLENSFLLGLTEGEEREQRRLEAALAWTRRLANARWEMVQEAQKERDYMRSVLEQFYTDSHDALSAVLARPSSPTGETPPLLLDGTCPTCRQTVVPPHEHEPTGETAGQGVEEAHGLTPKYGDDGSIVAYVERRQYTATEYLRRLDERDAALSRAESAEARATAAEARATALMHEAGVQEARATAAEAERDRLRADLAAAEANQDTLAGVVDSGGQLDQLTEERDRLREAVGYWARAYGRWDDTDSIWTCGICEEDGGHADGCPAALVHALAGESTGAGEGE